MLIGARQECVNEGADLATRMATLKGLGYDFVELTLGRDEIAGLGPDSAQPYLDDIGRTGLPILSTSFGHFGGFADLDDDGRKEIVEHIRACVRLTKEIGADVILLATREEDLEIGGYVDTYRRALLPVADEAIACGVRLALEHVGRFKPSSVARLARALAHPAIGVYFDMGNCLYVGESPVEQARICAPVAVQLHVKGGPVAPLAAMPLAPVRERLEAAGYQGRCCLEIPSTNRDLGLTEALGLLKLAGYR